VCAHAFPWVRTCLCVRECVRASVCVCVWNLVGVGARSWACAYLSSMPRRGAILDVATLAPPHFVTLSHKQHGFRKNVTEHKMCVFIFSTTSYKTFLILRRIRRDIVVKVKTSPRKFLYSYFNETWIFSTGFRKNLTYKVVQIWPGLFLCKQVTVCPSHIWTTLY
jgi:hypothetical protein